MRVLACFRSPCASQPAQCQWLAASRSGRRWRRASPSTTSDDAARARSALARSAPHEARPPQTHFWWSCGGSCLQSRVRESKSGSCVCMCFDVSAGSRNAKFSSDARFARGALRAIDRSLPNYCRLVTAVTENPRDTDRRDRGGYRSPDARASRARARKFISANLGNMVNTQP